MGRGEVRRQTLRASRPVMAGFYSEQAEKTWEGFEYITDNI